MATTYALEVQPQVATPPGKSPGSVQGGRMRRWRATINLAAQASGDDIVLANPPAGHQFAFGVMNQSVGLGGTATVAIGVAGNTGKYRTAAIANTAGISMFGNTAAAAMDPLGATGETVLATIAAAALPGAGTVVIDLYFSAP